MQRYAFSSFLRPNKRETTKKFTQTNFFFLLHCVIQGTHYETDSAVDWRARVFRSACCRKVSLVSGELLNSRLPWELLPKTLWSYGIREDLRSTRWLLSLGPRLPGRLVPRAMEINGGLVSDVEGNTTLKLVISGTRSVITVTWRVMLQEDTRSLVRKRTQMYILWVIATVTVTMKIRL